MHPKTRLEGVVPGRCTEVQDVSNTICFKKNGSQPKRTRKRCLMARLSKNALYSEAQSLMTRLSGPWHEFHSYLVPREGRALHDYNILRHSEFHVVLQCFIITFGFSWSEPYLLLREPREITKEAQTFHNPGVGLHSECDEPGHR